MESRLMEKEEEKREKKDIKTSGSWKPANIFYTCPCEDESVCERQYVFIFGTCNACRKTSRYRYGIPRTGTISKELDRRNARPNKGKSEVILLSLLGDEMEPLSLVISFVGERATHLQRHASLYNKLLISSKKKSFFPFLSFLHQGALRFLTATNNNEE